MTSMPASRRARAMIFAPRSCPSSPGLATTTRILRAVGLGAGMRPPAVTAAAGRARIMPIGARPTACGLRSADADRHLHVRRVDRADDPVRAAAGELLAVGAGPLDRRPEAHRSTVRDDVVRVLPAPAEHDRVVALDRDR